MRIGRRSLGKSPSGGGIEKTGASSRPDRARTRGSEIDPAGRRVDTERWTGLGRPPNSTVVAEALIFDTGSRGFVAIPAKIQNDIKQFQRLQQELGAVQQQRLQMDLKLRELTHTLEELQSVPEESPIYRPIGGLLVRAQNKKEVQSLLSDEKETLEIRLKGVERQENHLKERYSTMQKEITDALQSAGLGGASDAPTA
ncbi:Prefoldin, beta subunit [mine drainage metagenome]|uniref:Prefoldin subunit beta n=1 Tax=mine drainage metagenome TaxID=410659 RepID=T1CNK5_9ZZZZ